MCCKRVQIPENAAMLVRAAAVLRGVLLSAAGAARLNAEAGAALAEAPLKLMLASVAWHKVTAVSAVAGISVGRPTYYIHNCGTYPHSFHTLSLSCFAQVRAPSATSCVL